MQETSESNKDAMNISNQAFHEKNYRWLEKVNIWIFYTMVIDPSIHYKTVKMLLFIDWLCKSDICSFGPTDYVGKQQLTLKSRGQ